MITKEEIEQILGENVENLDQLTTAIKNYIDNKSVELTNAFKVGDEDIKNLLSSDLDRLKEFKELIDSLDGDKDGEVNLTTILSGIKGDISKNADDISSLKKDLEDKINIYNALIERISKIESDVNTLKETDMTHFEIWNELLTGLTSFRDTLKISIEKFTVIQDTSSDNNVL